jgi:hypothetical protein
MDPKKIRKLCHHRRAEETQAWEERLSITFWEIQSPQAVCVPHRSRPGPLWPQTIVKQWEMV